MDRLDRLEALEAIRMVKARYCRCLDTRDWDGLAAIFAEDIVLDVSEDTHQPPFHGRDVAIAQIKAAVIDAKTAHQVHSTEIAFAGDDEADAITAMQDRVVWAPGRSPLLGVASITGFGHYHERYVRHGDGWVIAALTLTRLYVEMHLEPVAG
ncbi:nuclear transport factor 2 family protein [Sphingomonas solaris]|uniref:Nuclear transport factor 2 family protein n=1 Tax=Alterirhizorhabdus solaris TaxID=2529389 RepID=A0A558RCN3_9SPHN|nr:nuclear transport factor 2 family protein [Sphingomonas solaris]TVV77108.1 nuclear transport factor 2 family protein [Sphingomonas solaris]